MTDSRQRLLEIVRATALLRGEFKLSSGGTSNVYLDCRRATLDPEGAFLTASLLLDWLDSTGLGVDCVGGPTLGADPIVGAMVPMSWQRGRPLPGFLVRKEAKGHGTGQRLEGRWQPGWRALIVEDTTTTGRSLLDAVEAAEEAGLVVVATACLVDRGAATAKALAGHRFHSLFHFDEVIARRLSPLAMTSSSHPYIPSSIPMTTLNPKQIESLEIIARDVVAPQAQRVDKDGAFPEHSVAALAEAGLLGAISARDVGGLGLGPRAAATIVERLARDCGSTAMVATMHYCGAAVLEKHASESIRREAASGRHLSTLAFSEAGSRSHFWAPVGSAHRVSDRIELEASKTFVTSAHRATAYVWSSRPVAAEGLSTIWLVPRDTPGVSISGAFDGLGLRGNDSAPVKAEKAVVPEASRLGADGGGFDVMMGIVLPLFNVLESACASGLMESGMQRTVAHVSGTKYEYSGTALCELPTIRNIVARMRCGTDMAKTLLDDTITAIETGRADTMLRVLQAKAVTGDMANEVLDLAMRACGGAAFRKDVGVERAFRDARAMGVMAPTTDVLYDFIGKAACGMDLFG